MSAANDILEFSGSRSLWQQDLIRRIHCQTSLSAADIGEVLTFLKEEYGLVTVVAANEDATPSPQPLCSSDMPAATSENTNPTTLIAVKDAQNANRLAPNQHLPFARKGITLIFGFNGSGKSGYGRILKRACRSRQDKQNRMYGDVYGAIATPPASAVIEFEEGINSRSFHWHDGSRSSEALARISVFDAETAPLYANQQNKIEFLPRGLDVLPRLGSVCEELQRQIDQEITSAAAMISAQLHDFDSKTYQDLMAGLAATTAEANLLTVADIEAAGAWDESWEQKVKQVENQLRDLSEPAAKSAKLRRLKSAVDSLEERLSLNMALLSVESYSKYLSAYGASFAANENARLAAEGRFTGDPFGRSISSSQWRKLYTAAREFSELIYPDQTFPFVGIDALCVLCQQPLSMDARNRLERFQLFVEDMSQRTADQAVAVLRGETESVKALQLPTEDGIKQSLAEYVAEMPDGPELVSAAIDCLNELNLAKIATLSLLENGTSNENYAGVSRESIDKLESASSRLEEQIQQLDAASKDTAALTILKAEHVVLLDRKAFASFKTVLQSRLENLRYILTLRKCRAACDTRIISIKSSAMREKYLTADFTEKVALEIENLGLDYLPVRVEGRTDRGASMIGVTLDKLAKVSTADILSEGEFRALALGCFLAEVSMIDGHDGIIIDDPVSSLDHLHCLQIAKRLVEEALHGRQVIIFTHDLPFYSAVMSMAAEARVPLHPNWIQQNDGEFGVVSSDDSPWEAKNLNQRISVLERGLAAIPDPKSISREEFMKLVKSFYVSLRETWERLVEERLLADVVGRFELGVKTQSLKTVHVTNDDFTRVHFGMARASTFSGHDRARGMQAATPTIAEMKADLEKIRTYAKDLKDRNRALEDERKKLLEPAQAEVVREIT